MPHAAQRSELSNPRPQVPTPHVLLAAPCSPASTPSHLRSHTYHVLLSLPFLRSTLLISPCERLPQLLFSGGQADHLMEAAASFQSS